MMAAGGRNFLMRLLIIVSTVLLQVLRASRMWRRCEGLGFLSVFFSHHWVQLGTTPPAGLGPDQPQQRCYFCLPMQTPSPLHSRPLKEQSAGHHHLVLRGAQQMSNDLGLLKNGHGLLDFPCTTSSRCFWSSLLLRSALR